MGLVYNHKNKLDLVVLSEEELEKNEGELNSFVILSGSEACGEIPASQDGGKERMESERDA